MSPCPSIVTNYLRYGVSVVLEIRLVAEKKHPICNIETRDFKSSLRTIRYNHAIRL